MRRPAHASLEKQPIQWGDTSLLEKREIGKFFGRDISGNLLKKIDAQSQDLVGYYRVLGPENAFVKVLWNHHCGSHLVAEKIACWLKVSGIDTSCVRSGFPKRLDAYDAQIFVYDYINYDFASADPTQLRAIGQSLGMMHSLFKTYPDWAQIKLNGLAKNRTLRHRLTTIQKERWECKALMAVTDILQQVNVADIDLLEDGAQMVHGDMNNGNVLIDRTTKRPVVIDFEDAATSWLSPLYDVAFIIQRFIFTKTNLCNQNLLESFIQGYRQENRIQASKRSDILYQIYKMISIRSMLVLSQISDEQQADYVDEYKKFVWLYNDAECKAMLLNDAYESLVV